MFRTIIITTLLLCGSMLVKAQSSQRLTLNNCYELAQKNYPLIGQYELLEKIKELSLENTSRGYLPQLTISGYATYQSEVTSVPISLPNVDIPTLDKDQYRIYVELNQSVTDLFSTMKHQKENIRLSTEVEKQRTAVELHKIKERVSELYFSILLVNTQLEQNEIVKKDIELSIKKNDVAIANGVALKSSADVLQAELLSVKQQTIKLEATKKGLVDMLSLFVGQTIDNQVVLEEPLLEIIDSENNRPELLLYESQKKSYENQKKLINDKSLPKLSLFVQGGYGKPSLNMFSSDFDTYYMGGVRLNWNLSNFYT
ncbi:MAG: TolC family protein, partial [Capnocytophaga sp.]|nr:TolC family protein [Capnocytophaga sp.]